MVKINHYSTPIILGLIVLAATVLRLYALGRADLITDEASINFRAIGYLDFLGTPYQTTPLEWLRTWPWWLNLSFHDLPPLFFWLQHLMFSWWGVSVVVMRLLPAISGIASVAMIFILGRRLFNPTVGLVAAAIMAVNDYHLWISRLAQQESLVILLILAAVYVYLRTLE